MIRKISSDAENNLIDLTPTVSLSVDYLECKRKCVEILRLLIQNAPNNQEKSSSNRNLSAECLLLVL